MSAATTVPNWDGLDDLPPIQPPRRTLPFGLPLTCCTLHPTIYTLHSTLMVEEGATVTPAMRIQALNALEENDPALFALHDKQVTRRMTGQNDNRIEALAALIPFLFRAVSGVIAEQLAAIDWLLNQGVYNRPMAEHLTAQKALWDQCEQSYPADLSPDERAVYGALATKPEEQAAFRILRDLAINGGGEFYMGCDQLGARLGINGVAGWRLLEKLRGDGYRMISKVRAGTKREKGTKAKAAYYKWELPIPAAAFKRSAVPSDPSASNRGAEDGKAAPRESIPCAA